MKTYEFPLKLSPDGRLEVPGDVAPELSGAGQGRVIVVLQEDEMNGAEEDRAWRELGLKQLASAYGPEDAIYDDLEDETL